MQCVTLHTTEDLASTFTLPVSPRTPVLVAQSYARLHNCGMPTTTRLSGPMSGRLKTIRLDAGLTQQDIADATGLALKTVNNYENPQYAGARKFVNVQAIATLCGRDVYEVWGARGQQIPRTGCTSPTPAYALAS